MKISIDPEAVNEAIEQLKNLENVNGIIVFVAGDQQEYGATGHVDLLYNDAWGDPSIYSLPWYYNNDLDDYLNKRSAASLSIYIWLLTNESNDDSEGRIGALKTAKIDEDMKTSKYNFLLISTIIGMACCNSRTNNQSYQMITYDLGEDCEMYVMHFDDGELYQRIALSGTCPGLTGEVYLDQVINHFNEIKLDPDSVKGKLIFEFYEFHDRTDLKSGLKDIIPRSQLLEEGETYLTLYMNRAQ